MANVLPAHETKHLDLLSYHYFDHIFDLTQLSDGQSNGTALWLGAQCLSVFLVDVLPARKLSPKPTSTLRLQTDHATSPASSKFVQQSRPTRRPRAIELGSGVGLTALALATLGWDVVATDITSVVRNVLRPNIQRNMRLLHERNGCIHAEGMGTVQVRELDWTVEVKEWKWDDPACIASPQLEDQANTEMDNRKGGLDHKSDATELLCPPFELIVTSDTLYSASLVTPLLRTLHHLCLLSTPISPHVPGPDASDTVEGKRTTGSPFPISSKSPTIYLALENRDPGLVSSFLTQAKEEWGFSLSRIPYRRIIRSMERGGLNWAKNEWEGVEIWKLQIGSPAVRNREDLFSLDA